MSVLSKIWFTCFDWEMTFIFVKLCVLSKQIPFVSVGKCFSVGGVRVCVCVCVCVFFLSVVP